MVPATSAYCPAWRFERPIFSWLKRSSSWAGVRFGGTLRTIARVKSLEHQGETSASNEKEALGGHGYIVLVWTVGSLGFLHEPAGWTLFQACAVQGPGSGPREKCIA